MPVISVQKPNFYVFIAASIDFIRTRTYNDLNLIRIQVIAMTCCFFGHKDSPSTIAPKLERVLTDLIVTQGVDSFIMGHQGHFDAMVLSAVRKMKERYPYITYKVVLAYMPGKKEEWSPYAAEETMYPEGLEFVPRRFAISWRNKWMINESDVVVCYITHSWGGAAQYVELAECKKKLIVNLATRQTI